jgi:hypothetical protein
MALEVATGAAAETSVAGSGSEAAAAALGPTMSAFSTSTGLGFAHLSTLAGVDKRQRAKHRV